MQTESQPHVLWRLILIPLSANGNSLRIQKTFAYPHVYLVGGPHVEIAKLFPPFKNYLWELRTKTLAESCHVGTLAAFVMENCVYIYIYPLVI